MTPRSPSKRLALAVAVVFVAIVLMLLLFLAGKESTDPSVLVTAVRTNGGAVVTASVPRPYAPGGIAIRPEIHPPGRLDPRVEVERATNGLQIVVWIPYDPEGPYRLTFLMDAPTRGFGGLAGKVRACVRLRDLRALVRPCFDGLEDFYVEAFVFGASEPGGCTNRAADVRRIE